MIGSWLKKPSVCPWVVSRVGCVVSRVGCVVSRVGSPTVACQTNSGHNFKAMINFRRGRKSIVLFVVGDQTFGPYVREVRHGFREAVEHPPVKVDVQGSLESKDTYRP